MSNSTNRSVSTRTNSRHWLFGKCQDGLLLTKLPTKLDIIKFYFYSKNFMLHIRNHHQLLSEEDKDNIYDALARDVSDLWKSSSIPFLEFRFIKMRIQQLVEEAEKTGAKKGYYKNNLDWIEKRRSEYEVLFDIALCRCFKTLGFKKLDISQVIPANCKCSPESGKKISNIKQSTDEYTDFEFYRDQLFSRKLDITSSIDVKSSIEMDNNSQKIESRKRRREADEKALEKARSTSTTCLDDTIDQLES